MDEDNESLSGNDIINDTVRESDMEFMPLDSAPF